MKKILSISAILCLFSQTQLFSQSGVPSNRLTVGASLHHFYDINFQPNNLLPSSFEAEDMKGMNGNQAKFDLGLGFNAGWYFSPLWSADLGFYTGKMTGSGRYEFYNANVSFLQLGTNISIKPFARATDYKLVPFVRFSLGQSNYTSSRYFIEDEKEFSSTKGKSLNTGLGAGIRYHITPNIDINLISEFVTNFTDAWDGYNNSNGYDRMINTRIGLNYTFGRNNHINTLPAFTAINNQNNSVSTDNQNEALRKEEEAKFNRLNDSVVWVLRQIQEVKASFDSLSLELHKKMNEGINANSVANANNETNNKSYNLQNYKAITTLSTIYFSSDSYYLDFQAQQILLKLTQIMKEQLSLKLELIGHADERGAESNNMRLSIQRAEAAKQFMIKQGIAAERLVVVGKGETVPQDIRKTPEANKNNRRVEFGVR